MMMMMMTIRKRKSLNIIVEEAKESECLVERG
jgi:hypothetical protein